MAYALKNIRIKFFEILPIIFLFFISFNGNSIIDLNFFSISLHYIIVYYWVLRQPGTLGYGFIFIAGIITDVILGLPMGISSLSYLAIATLAAYTRIVTVRISLLTDWFTFVPALLTANFTYFLVLYFNDMPVNYLSLLLGALFTFLLYPFLWFIFEILRRLMKVGAHA